MWRAAAHSHCYSQSHSGWRPNTTGGLEEENAWEFSELTDLWLKPTPETYPYCLVHRKLPAPPGLLCQPSHPHLGSPFSLSASDVFLVHNYPVQNKARTPSQKDHPVDSYLLKQPLLLSSLAVQEHSSAHIYKSNVDWMSASIRTQRCFQDGQPCVLHPQTSVCCYSPMPSMHQWRVNVNLPLYLSTPVLPVPHGWLGWSYLPDLKLS